MLEGASTAFVLPSDTPFLSLIRLRLEAKPNRGYPTDLLDLQIKGCFGRVSFWRNGTPLH
jgi:hypothetical protein